MKKFVSGIALVVLAANSASIAHSATAIEYARTKQTATRVPLTTSAATKFTPGFTAIKPAVLPPAPAPAPKPSSAPAPTGGGTAPAGTGGGTAPAGTGGPRPPAGGGA
jgi:hypothetical protein